MLYSLLVASLLAPEPGCHPQRIESGWGPNEVLQSCQRESQTQNRDYLGQWLGEQKRTCELRDTAPANYARCITEVVASAHEVLTCLKSPKRQREAVAFDVEQISSRFSEYEKSRVPQLARDMFARLTATAEKEFPPRFQRYVWTLSSYEHEIVNATAGAGGSILASSALWTFEQDEIAAVLAHEIAHVVKEHSLQLGCLALEWIGGAHTIAEATEIFREDLSDGFPRKTAWTRLSQDIELEADRLATVILAEAGFDPGAMAKALGRLRSMGRPGMVSGSHPELDDRINRLK